MKCHLCVNYIEMQTDPATCDYVIVSGARRKEERWDMAENEQILTTGKRFIFSNLNLEIGRDWEDFLLVEK